MKLTPSYLFYLSILFAVGIACSSCETEDEDPTIQGSPDALKILPLGDSRVEGARPEYESYRFELWKKLLEDSWDFDFIGTRRDNASYPDFQMQAFDKDHEGTGGAVTADILATVRNIETAEAPDIVLLGIGGNDLLDGEASPMEAIANVNSIIDQLQSLNSNVIIFLEQIARGESDLMTTELQTAFDEYNALIPDVASSQTTATSGIFVVDMDTNWSDDFLADPVHYNEQGAEIVAQRYFDAIKLNIIR